MLPFFVMQCASECGQITRPDPVLHGDGTHVPSTAQTRARSGDLLLFIDVVRCRITNYRCSVTIYEMMSYFFQIQEDKILIRVHYKEGSYQTFQIDGNFKLFPVYSTHIKAGDIYSFVYSRHLEIVLFTVVVYHVLGCKC